MTSSLTPTSSFMEFSQEQNETFDIDSSKGQRFHYSSNICRVCGSPIKNLGFLEKFWGNFPVCCEEQCFKKFEDRCIRALTKGQGFYFFHFHVKLPQAKL